MINTLHPLEMQAIEKLKQIKVGALYTDREESKIKTAAELISARLEGGKIEKALWLCSRRRVSALRNTLDQCGFDRAEVEICGIESLSHSLRLFLALMEFTGKYRTMILIDNGILIKNQKAMRTQRVIALCESCRYRLLISDVPFTRKVADMYSQWLALDWRILGYKSQWSFEVNHMPVRGVITNVDYLTYAIEPYCAQILERDISVHPEKREYVWRFPLPAAAAEEYNAVLQRFLVKATVSATGVYRLLQACQHVACGRRIVHDYPLKTEKLYANDNDNPRIQALRSVMKQMEEKRILILCRYGYEVEEVYRELQKDYAEKVRRYPFEKGDESAEKCQYMVMNVFLDEREACTLEADVMIYYSSCWNWRKRQEKEEKCLDKLRGKALTIVSIAASDTIDMKILKSLWKKENLVAYMRQEIHALLKNKG